MRDYFAASIKALRKHQRPCGGMLIGAAAQYLHRPQTIASLSLIRVSGVELKLKAANSRPVDGRATRWSGQREKRRDEFVEAALEAIAEYGPQASIEQVADHVGVTRTKLYRYFDGATDLHHSVARRASEMLTTKQTLVWDGPLSPMQVVRSTVSMHVRWRIEHPNLYEYLTRHSLSDADAVSAIDDVNSTVAENLAAVIAAFYRTLGLDERPAMPLSIGAVGFVESAVTHWLKDPAALPRREFTTQLAEWMWSLLSCSLLKGGIDIDPHEPMAPQNPVVASPAG